ncbi:site-specific integrase [Erysipelotrichaceae bacterium RD49]|nr:site-specific integrase [Erysipelotrichaceae bacterium RD49]
MAVLHKADSNIRKVRDIETFIQALGYAEGTLLGLCMYLAFSCSLRIGEILGLTWDDVVIDEQACVTRDARLKVEKEMTRIPCRCLEDLGQKDISRIFPTNKKDASTRLILKSPKTKSSNRIVWLPETIAELLIAHEDGRPAESRFILKKLHNLCDAHGLEVVDFHSLRHLSTSYKLKLTNGDVKSVQGDTGHSQASMVVEVYSRILDEDRRKNAKKLEEQFYQKKESCQEADYQRLKKLIGSLTAKQREEQLKINSD